MVVWLAKTAWTRRAEMASLHLRAGLAGLVHAKGHPDVICAVTCHLRRGVGAVFRALPQRRGDSRSNGVRSRTTSASPSRSIASARCQPRTAVRARGIPGLAWWYALMAMPSAGASSPRELVTTSRGSPVAARRVSLLGELFAKEPAGRPGAVAVGRALGAASLSAVRGDADPDEGAGAGGPSTAQEPPAEIVSGPAAAAPEAAAPHVAEAAPEVAGVVAQERGHPNRLGDAGSS
jgi:hypothetical protein